VIVSQNFLDLDLSGQRDTYRGEIRATQSPHLAFVLVLSNGAGFQENSQTVALV
jgi:hypothetical protein